jgi:outer membrane protein assembly factor BamD
LTRHITLLLLLSLSACNVFRPNRGSGPRIETTGREPTEIYDHGIRAMQRGMFDRAEEDFQELRNFHRDDPLSVKAQLALADISYRKGEYEEARFAYQEFASYHPRHPDLDYVTFQIGLCHWKRTPKMAGRDQSLTRAAVNTWTGFSNRYPDSTHQETVDRVLQRGYDRLAAKELWVARFYRKRDAWTAVESRSRYLLTRFPSSEHAEEALALLTLSFQELGRPQDAIDARARLAEQYPASRYLVSVDNRLSKPPGSPPEEEVFVRPYRLPGGATAPPGR